MFSKPVNDVGAAVLPTDQRSVSQTLAVHQTDDGNVGVVNVCLQAAQLDPCYHSDFHYVYLQT